MGFTKGHNFIGNIEQIRQLGKDSAGRLGVKCPAYKNGKWKYSTIHKWVKWHKGIPQECQFCGKKYTYPKSIHWANIDHKYRRVLEDYIPLCVPCHKNYDIENNLKNDWKLDAQIVKP